MILNNILKLIVQYVIIIFHLKNNSNINYCNNCDNNICNNCNKNHNNKYPDHDKNKVKLSVIKPNEKLPLWQCKLCNDNLNKDQPVHHCNTCQNDLYNNYGDNHAQNNPNHNLSLVQYALLKPFDETQICNKCETDLNDLAHKKCNNCDILLCNEYEDNHKTDKPSHKVKSYSR